MRYVHLVLFTICLVTIVIINPVNAEVLFAYPEVGKESISGVSVMGSILSPLKQFKSGIPANEVQCKENLVLVIKYVDGSPACVKQDTKNVLVERGWIRTDETKTLVETKEVKTVPHTYVTYSMEENKVKSIGVFDDGRSLDCVAQTCNLLSTIVVITLEPTEKTNQLFKITLPRTLIDSKVGEKDDNFFVLVNDKETLHTESKNDTYRTLNFFLSKNTEEIKIIGYDFHNEDLPVIPYRLSTGLKSLPDSIHYDAEGEIKLGQAYLREESLTIPIESHSDGKIDFKISKAVFDKLGKMDRKYDMFILEDSSGTEISYSDYSTSFGYVMFSVNLTTESQDIILKQLPYNE